MVLDIGTRHAHGLEMALYSLQLLNRARIFIDTVINLQKEQRRAHTAHSHAYITDFPAMWSHKHATMIRSLCCSIGASS